MSNNKKMYKKIMQYSLNITQPLKIIKIMKPGEMLVIFSSTNKAWKLCLQNEHIY